MRHINPSARDLPHPRSSGAPSRKEPFCIFDSCRKDRRQMHRDAPFYTLLIHRKRSPFPAGEGFCKLRFWAIDERTVQIFIKSALTTKKDREISHSLSFSVGANCVRPRAFAERPYEDDFLSVGKICSITDTFRVLFVLCFYSFHSIKLSFSPFSL